MYFTLNEQFSHILEVFSWFSSREVTSKYLTSLSHSKSCLGDLGTPGQEEDVVRGVVN